MGKPISEDLRERVVEAYEEGEGTQEELAERFKLSRSSVFRYLQRRQNGEPLQARPHGGGRPTPFDVFGLERLLEIVSDKPDSTDRELSKEFTRRTGKNTSRAAISRALKKIGLTRKKKTFAASERNNPEVQRKREEFLKEMSNADANHLLFLDESGSNIAMSSCCALSPRGLRAYDQKPLNRGTNVTMVSLLTIDGVDALRTFEGSMNTERFVAYIKEEVVPLLTPKDVLIMDNLTAHHAQEVKALVESKKATIRFLPPYSPDLNPVDFCWSKVKRILRKLGKRSVEKLVGAITHAFSTVTPNDARGWFLNCGYTT
jgi:transposase